MIALRAGISTVLPELIHARNETQGNASLVVHAFFQLCLVVGESDTVRVDTRTRTRYVLKMSIEIRTARIYSCRQLPCECMQDLQKKC